MELESPVDAWYVWVGVAIVSVAIAGIAMGFPSGPPPDANAAANTIDRVAANSYDASARYEHDADEVRITRKQLSMRNEHGTTHASIAFGEMLYVGNAADDEALREVVQGTDYREVYCDSSSATCDPESAFHRDVEAAQADATDPQWQLARGELVVRTVTYEHQNTEHEVTLVDA